MLRPPDPAPVIVVLQSSSTAQDIAKIGNTGNSRHPGGVFLSYPRYLSPADIDNRTRREGRTIAGETDRRSLPVIEPLWRSKNEGGCGKPVNVLRPVGHHCGHHSHKLFHINHLQSSVVFIISNTCLTKCKKSVIIGHNRSSNPCGALKTRVGGAQSVNFFDRSVKLRS
jgi:hypothetical protein